MSSLLAEHLTYVTDSIRLRAYQQALQTLVTPGSVVLDLGAGTDVLGQLALQAGAARVYAVDATETLELARTAFGTDKRVHFLREHSTDVSLPEKVDLVVADQMGPIGLGAGLLESFEDAVQRHLKPGGVLVPSVLQLWCAPVRMPALRAAIDGWKTFREGIDLSSIATVAADHVHSMAPVGVSRVGEAFSLGTLELGKRASPLRVEKELRIEDETVLDGLVGWFSVQLAPGVAMTNDPFSPQRIDRWVLLFPLLEQRKLCAGDRLVVRMDVEPYRPSYTWRVAKHSAERTTADWSETRSTFRGLLLTPEDLERQRPTHVPQLKPKAMVRLTVLSAAAKGATVAAITKEVCERHRELFASEASAAHFVAKVLAMEAR